MARIVLAGYMVRYPLGGNLSSTLEYLLALRRLGHDVSFVERAGYPRSCWDPIRNVMSDDPQHGLDVVGALLRRFGVDEWLYLDAAGRYHGPSAARCASLFRSADVYIDYGAHGTWADEASTASTTVLIDGEPGFNQIKMEAALAAGQELPSYDHYFTTGHNLGTPSSPAPTAGRSWRHLFHPVNVTNHDVLPPPRDARFTTVMNWQSHDRIEHHGTVFGQKDVEFPRFDSLPSRLRGGAELLLAVGGPNTPTDELSTLGWHLVNGHDVTLTYDRFLDFIDGSSGEFSVCKNVFVALNTGWFSDRSAVYLARGRPVVMQETGFSDHLPTGEGLFAVRDADEAVAAIEAILAQPEQHSRRARDIAREHLDGAVVMRQVLAEIGVRSGRRWGSTITGSVT